MVNVISDERITADEEFGMVWKQQSWCILRYSALMSYEILPLGEDMGKTVDLLIQNVSIKLLFDKSQSVISEVHMEANGIHTAMKGKNIFLCFDSSSTSKLIPSNRIYNTKSLYSFIIILFYL
jgi:hypothetical protein